MAQSEAGVRVSNLARTVKQPKASAYRILLTLETLGYVRQDADAVMYHCTAHAAWLTRDQANETLRRIAPRMERLIARFEQTVNLAIFDQDAIFYIEILKGLRSIRLAATPMTYATTHSTAVGKSILAFLHPSEALQILKEHPLEKHSSKTVASERMILAQLA